VLRAAGSVVSMLLDAILWCFLVTAKCLLYEAAVQRIRLIWLTN